MSFGDIVISSKNYFIPQRIKNTFHFRNRQGHPIFMLNRKEITKHSVLQWINCFILLRHYSPMSNLWNMNLNWWRILIIWWLHLNSKSCLEICSQMALTMVCAPMDKDAKNGLNDVISYWKYLFMDHPRRMIQTVVREILKYGLLDHSIYLRERMILFSNNK